MALVIHSWILSHLSFLMTMLKVKIKTLRQVQFACIYVYETERTIREFYSLHPCMYVDLNVLLESLVEIGGAIFNNIASCEANAEFSIV